MEVLSLRKQSIRHPCRKPARPSTSRDLLPGRMKLNRQLLLHRFNLPELPP